VGVTSLAVGCVVAWPVDPIWEPEVACLLRLFFGCASASGFPATVGSGDRALLAGAFLVEVAEEDLAPADLAFAVFWQRSWWGQRGDESQL
jgi:hypothetical protein